MMTSDVEKGDEPAEQVLTKEDNVQGENDPNSDETMRRRRRRNFGIVLVTLIAIGLIVGLSVGLTRPNGESSSAASLAGQDTATSPPSKDADDEDDGSDEASPATTSVKFQSSGTRAFNVTMDLLSPAILEGYDNDDDLKEDLGQAVRFFINTFIEDQIRYGRYMYGVMEDGGIASGDDMAAGDAPMNEGGAGKGESAAGATDFETNNQVDGVDEADMVKSDGTYVYAVYGDAIVVWEAATGTYVTNYTLPAPNATYSWGGGGIMYRNLKQSANASCGEDCGGDGGGMMGDAMMPWTPTAFISGMSLESDRLVVYASGYGPDVVAANNVSSACPYDAYGTRVLIFSTPTPSSPFTLIAQKDIHGSFRDARAIGDDIHMVTTCSFDFYSMTEPLYIMNDAFVNMTDDKYRTAAAKKAEPLIDAFVELMVMDIYANGKAKIPKVSLWATQTGNNTDVVEQANSGGAIQAFTSLVSFSVADLIDDDSELELSATGACTPTTWGYTYTIDGWVVIAEQGWEWNRDLEGTSQSTYMLGFSIDGTTASPAIIGSFPGYILNQYAISIYEGHLRVATTISSWIAEPIVGNSTNSSATNSTGSGGSDEVVDWPTFTPVTMNQVIILKLPTATGEMMEEVSRISDLGKKGEVITAINYFGPIAYVVTFLQTDPFYVLDLNPADPSVLGELEINGFSEYIHSINDDNTLLVAVGQEADVNGTVLGVKIALFNATDPASPKEISSAAVELEEGTWSSSQVSWDYKAFRWLSLANANGVVILPVRIDAAWTDTGPPTTGNFDGFYVYNVSPKDGISLRFKISHVDSADFYGCYWGSNLPQRSMVFNGNVTTLKGHSVVSTDLDTGKETWAFDLPKPADQNFCHWW